MLISDKKCIKFEQNSETFTGASLLPGKAMFLILHLAGTGVFFPLLKHKNLVSLAKSILAFLIKNSNICPLLCQLNP